MNIGIAGCGKMAQGVVFDLLKNKSIEKIIVADKNPDALLTLKKRFPQNKIKFIQTDISKLKNCRKFMRGLNAVLGAASYKLNLVLTKAAILEKVNYCDLGGNNSVVKKQFELHRKANKSNITIIPDCGLAPGLTNILVADGVKDFNKIDEVKIRVGGLPQKPVAPFNYTLVFSVEGLINEYVEPAYILKNFKIKKVDSLTDVEEINFPQLFGKLEAFNTSGGVSTLVKTFSGKIKNLNYKTIRYSGHCNLMFTFKKLGLMRKGKPRKMFEDYLNKKLPRTTNDVVLVKVTITGLLKNKKAVKNYSCVDYADNKNKLTAMMRMTSLPASIILQMLANKEVKKYGVLPAEKIIDTQKFIFELNKRGVNLKVTKKLL